MILVVGYCILLSSNNTPKGLSSGTISNFTIPNNSNVVVKQFTAPTDSSRGKNYLISIKMEGNFAVTSNTGRCQFTYSISNIAGDHKIGCESCQGAYPYIVSTTVTVCRQSDTITLKAFQHANAGTITVYDCNHTVILLQSW